MVRLAEPAPGQAPAGRGLMSATRRTYLDYNATAPLRPEAAEAVSAALAEVGNPSSVHWHGRRAHALVEDAREAVAHAVGADPAGVVFTAGGTEANNLALAFGAERPLLVSALEHDSVLAAAARRGATVVPATPAGLVDLEALDALLAEAEAPAVVALMLVNNETGAIQPVAQAAALCRTHGALLLCDAVQALGRVPVDMALLDADMLAFSAHKLGGPQGVGALVLRPGVTPPPLLAGGGQERGRRPGTHNVAGIAGFAAAVAAAVADDLAGLAAWRDAMERRLDGAARAVRVVGADAARVAGTSCLACPGLPAETQVIALDLAGVSVSAGAACSSGKVAASHVLRAMGLGDDVAGCAIRVSGGWASREEDFQAFADAYVQMLRGASRAA